MKTLAMKTSPGRRHPFARRGIPGLRGAALALAATLLVACSTAPQQEAQWIDPALGAQSRLLQGARVLVACDAYDAAVRQICQDRLYRELQSRGASPVVVPAGTVLLTDRELDGQLVGIAAGLDAKAVLTMTLTPATTSAGSGASLGLGGFSFGGGGGAGIGLSVPIGGNRTSTGFAASGRVTDVGTRRLAWTATVVAQPSSDLDAQVTTLSRTLLDSARSAGLFAAS